LPLAPRWERELLRLSRLEAPGLVLPGCLRLRDERSGGEDGVSWMVVVVRGVRVWRKS
jgi:hypothetical protein